MKHRTLTPQDTASLHQILQESHVLVSELSRSAFSAPVTKCQCLRSTASGTTSAAPFATAHNGIFEHPSTTTRRCQQCISSMGGVITKYSSHASPKHSLSTSTTACHSTPGQSRARSSTRCQCNDPSITVSSQYSVTYQQSACLLCSDHIWRTTLCCPNTSTTFNFGHSNPQPKSCRALCA